MIIRNDKGQYDIDAMLNAGWYMRDVPYCTYEDFVGFKEVLGLCPPESFIWLAQSGPWPGKDDVKLYRGQILLGPEAVLFLTDYVKAYRDGKGTNQKAN